jgi:hypothetical protein
MPSMYLQFLQETFPPKPALTEETAGDQTGKVRESQRARGQNSNQVFAGLSR